MEDTDKTLNPNPNEKPKEDESIHDKSFEELLAEDEGGDWDETEKKQETQKTEKPTTPPVQKQPEQQPSVQPVQSAPNIDPARLKQEISQETAQKVIEALSGGKKQEEELYPWEKEGRNPTYKEALDYTAKKAAETVKSDLQREVEEEERREAAEREAQEQQAQRARQSWNSYWDNELSDLEESGRIPKMVNPKDPNDPGRKARIELFETMQKVSKERIKANKSPLMSLKETYHEHVAGKQRQPAGHNAPVHGSQRSVSPNNTETFSYSEIQGKGFDDLLMGR